MKKTFWGYDTKEVDAEIESLEAQVYKLTQKLKKIETERGDYGNQLEELTAQLREAREISVSAEKRIENANAAAETAKAEAEQAKEMLAKVQSEGTPAVVHVAAPAIPEDGFESVGEICRAAYADMVNVKSMTREKMELLLARYAEGWNKSNELLKQLTDGIRASRDKAKEAFIASAEQILNQMSGMDDALAEVDANIADYEANTDEIVGEFKEIISDLDEKPVADEAPVIEEVAPEEPEEEMPAIIRAIKNRVADANEAPTEAPAAENNTVAPAADEKSEEKQWGVFPLKFKPTADSGKPLSAVDVAVSVETKDIFG